MIRADGVVVAYGARRVLDGVDLAVRPGTVTGVVGPNGCGKTTLVRALLRAVRLAAGRVEVDGHDLTTRSRLWLARRVAYVGQHPEPDPALTVADEVGLGVLVRTGALVGGARHDAAVVAALEAVGLADLATAPLARLSGGELQRVGLARAIAQGAEHVLLDEPLNHLDVRHRLEVLELLPRIAPAVLVVLHDLELAARHCDEVLLLDRGRVVASGPPGEVLVPDLLERTYDVRVHRVADPDGHPHFAFTLPPGHAPVGAIPERTS